MRQSAASPLSDQFTRWVVELMQLIGPVTARRMFGGQGLFIEGLMIGIVHKNTLYLKSDQQSQSEFKALGLLPFSYLRSGKTVKLSYYQAPESLFEDHDELAYWSELSYRAAVRMAVSERKKRKTNN